MSKIFAYVICLLAVAGCAADLGGPADGVDLSGESLDLTGKSDAAEDVSVERVRGGFLATLRGDSALGLYGIMDDAGLSTTTRRGLTYVYARNFVCVTNTAAAACQVFSREMEEDVVIGDTKFAFTIHGARFSSAASEMFGFMAAAEDIDPRSTNQLQIGGYACGKGASDVWCGLFDEMVVDPPVDEPATLTVSLGGLGDLGPDYVYEGWLITDAGPIAAGRFNLSSGDETVSVEVAREVADAATMYVLTIEPVVGDVPAPSDTHVVAGVFNAAGEAELGMEHPAALGTNFFAATGSYILETPTSAPTDDYDLGVWWTPGTLSLPELPAGWVYEGWVVGENGPITTGTFVSPDMADSDAAGPEAGPLGFPAADFAATHPFPGQDFVTPPMSLIGTTIVISVEPSPDNSPAPFFLKPLVDPEVTDSGRARRQGMTNNARETEAFGFATLE